MVPAAEPLMSVTSTVTCNAGAVWLTCPDQEPASDAGTIVVAAGEGDAVRGDAARVADAARSGSALRAGWCMKIKVAATAIALLGQYEKILNYEVSVDFILFALVATSLFVFRRREGGVLAAGVHGTPGHPYTTALFVVACVAIVASTVWSDPGNSVKGWLILLTGIPVYLYWSRRRRLASGA